MCCVAQSGLTRNPRTSAPLVLELMSFAAGDWVPPFGTAQTYFSSVRHFQLLYTTPRKLVVLILELGEASSDHPVSG